jgi:TrkA-C domain
MGALVTVLIVILVSLLLTRIATIALVLTGMSRESARFQARSALTGVGFTTAEAESVVDHPVRRRIAMTLMLIGSAGIVTAAASLFLSFSGATGGQRLERLLILLGGLLLLLLLARSKAFDRAMSVVIGRLLRARGLDVRDYATLLDLEGDYAVNELTVEPEDWISGRTLGEVRLRDEGIVVLGIHRAGGGFVGVPHKHTRIEPGDTLVLYGLARRLHELDERPSGAAGDQAHAAAVAARQEEDRSEPAVGATRET